MVIFTILVLQEEYPACNQEFDQDREGIPEHSRPSFYSSDFADSSEIRPSYDYTLPEAVSGSVGPSNDDGFEASKLPTGGFICNYCSAFISNKSNMRRHINTHTGEKLFQCLICSKRFNRKAHMLGHMQTMHKFIVK